MYSSDSYSDHCNHQQGAPAPAFGLKEYGEPSSLSKPLEWRSIATKPSQVTRISNNYKRNWCESYMTGSCSPSSNLPYHHQYKNFHICRQKAVLLICYLAIALAFSLIPGTAGIDCFKCVSLNGDNPSCEDPFHNNYSVSILESPCMGGRKGRNGLFPATACIKLAGKYYDTGETITVRGCALDSGTLNVDTEIIRMSHCGHFWFDDRYVRGCLQSCDDADGCNHSSRPTHLSVVNLTLLLSISVFIITRLHFIPNLLSSLSNKLYCSS